MHELVAQLLNIREFLLARLAPTRPKNQDDDLAREVGQPHDLAVEISGSEIRSFFPFGLPFDVHAHQAVSGTLQLVLPVSSRGAERLHALRSLRRGEFKGGVRY